jgi:hypothetical protein
MSRLNWLLWAASLVTRACGFKSLVPTGHLVSLATESTSEESSCCEATGLRRAVTEAAVELTGVPPSSIAKPPRATISSSPVSTAVATAASPEPAAHSTRSLPTGRQSLDDLRVCHAPPATLTTTNPAVEPSATSEHRLLVPLFQLTTPSGPCSDCSPHLCLPLVPFLAAVQSR